jgi:hypothetical protein
MSYKQLVELLSPTQFLQLELVRQHLLQDPTALDRGHPKDTRDGKQEAGEEGAR